MALRPPGSEHAARLRAARGYAGLEREDIATSLNVSVRTYSRMESGDRPVGLEERQLAADACGVPRDFMETGWAAFGPVTDVDQRLRELEETVRSLAGERQSLLAEIGELVGREVAQALDSGRLPTDEADAATATPPATRAPQPPRP